MLTGCLFWGKARAMKGKMNIWKLWRGRLYRIAPLYFFSLLFVLFLAVIQTGSHWLALENWKPLLRLFGLGALIWHNIGQVNLASYNDGVVWTLRYEWGFYLILPFVAWLATGRKIFGFAMVVYVSSFIFLWFNTDLQWADFNFQFSLFFILGMLCPVLLEDQQLRSQLRHPVAAGGALLLAMLLFSLCRGHMETRLPSISLAGVLFPLFLVAAAGNSFFGFLTHPAIRCLGAISFSLYLLHGIMFQLVFHIIRTAGLTNLSRVDYWLIVIVTAIATTLLCAVTYCWIEFPFLSTSHKKPA
jgi:peptidoglycan/LPS O-acetylase OafA/YrhL